MRCPRCGDPDLDPTGHDDAGMVTCRCGLHAYAGYLAESAALDSRRAWLADRIAAGDPAPDPAVAAAYGIWAPPRASGADQPSGPGGYPRGGPATAPRPAHSAQAVLLGVGALLLIVAGAVFAAVVWVRIGIIGQIGLMVGMTVGVGVLAVRLRHRLAGTAEALAVVAAGLAAVDLVAAPLLGLVPEEWLSEPTLYPALAIAALGMWLLLLHARFGLRAWSWLGWLALPIAAGLVVPAVAAASTGAWTAAAISVPALTSLALLAAAGRRPRLADRRAPMRFAGWAGLALSAAATAGTAMDRASLPGSMLTTALAALAVSLWAGAERRAPAHRPPGGEDHRLGVEPSPAPSALGPVRLLWLAAACLAGITLGMALAIPPQPVWLPAIVALGGLAVGLVALLVTDDPLISVAGAAAAWLTWAWLRMTQFDPLTSAAAVDTQMSLLAAMVAVMAFAVAWWLPWTGWVGALLALLAMALAPWDAPDVVEVYSLPCAALLLLAGALWRRRQACLSLTWLGPAVAVALIPSALATWLAPWATGESGVEVGVHLLRLGAVLVGGVGAAVLGARWRLGGLLLPGAVALIITALAQVFGVLGNLPRWVGLGIAGTLLIVAGARVEALRREGRRAAAWVGDLR